MREVSQVALLDSINEMLSKKTFITKSPWIIHYDGASCNGCDIEVLDSLTPMFDIERFGIVNTGNPRQADIFLVTGSVNEACAPVVRQIYEQMVEPKVVIACGICACSGGVFAQCYNSWGGIDKVIPVDVYVPGCAVRPQAIIDGVVRGLEILERKRALLAAGQPVGVPHPAIENDELPRFVYKPGEQAQIVMPGVTARKIEEGVAPAIAQDTVPAQAKAKAPAGVQTPKGVA